MHEQTAKCFGRAHTILPNSDANPLHLPTCAHAQKVLSSQAGSTADSIVLLNQLQQWGDMQQLLSQAKQNERTCWAAAHSWLAVAACCHAAVFLAGHPRHPHHFTFQLCQIKLFVRSPSHAM